VRAVFCTHAATAPWSATPIAPCSPRTSGERTRCATPSRPLIQPLLQEAQTFFTVCRYGGFSPISRGRRFNGPALWRAGLGSNPSLLTHSPNTCSRVRGPENPQKIQARATGPILACDGRDGSDLRQRARGSPAHLRLSLAPSDAALIRGPARGSRPVRRRP
jgi:hypothetical protein